MGTQFPLPKGAQQPLLFGPCILWPNGRPSQLLLSEHLLLHAVHRVTVTLFTQQQIYGNLWSHYELYVVGQHGILCEVKW